MDILTSLEEQLKQRLEILPENSYTAKLFQGSENQLFKKITEEAGETILAMKSFSCKNSDENKNDLVYETADLVFHLITALVKLGIPWNEILLELEKRHKK